MNIQIYIQQFIDNRKLEFVNTSKSYFIYKYSFLLLLPTVLLFFINTNISYQYFDRISYLTTPLILIAFFIDFFIIVKLLWGTVYGKLIYTIFGYFTYIKTTIYAKKIIYINTGVNPDTFQSSIDFFSGWLLLPAWIIQINIILSVLIIILSILPQILLTFQIIIDPVIHNITINITNKIKKHIGSNILFHFCFFIIGASLFNLKTASIEYKIYKYSNYNLIKKIIRDNSYYISNIKTCNNKKVLYTDSIKLIGDNFVSVSRTDYKGNITFYKYICNK